MKNSTVSTINVKTLILHMAEIKKPEALANIYEFYLRNGNIVVASRQAVGHPLHHFFSGSLVDLLKVDPSAAVSGSVVHSVGCLAEIRRFRQGDKEWWRITLTQPSDPELELYLCRNEYSFAAAWNKALKHMHCCLYEPQVDSPEALLTWP